MKPERDYTGVTIAARGVGKTLSVFSEVLKKTGRDISKMTDYEIMEEFKYKDYWALATNRYITEKGYPKLRFEQSLSNERLFYKDLHSYTEVTGLLEALIGMGTGKKFVILLSSYDVEQIEEGFYGDICKLRLGFAITNYVTIILNSDGKEIII